MWFLSDLPFWIVGIAVVVFLIKLFVSLRVAHKAPVWEDHGDKEPAATNTDRAAAGIRTQQISLDTDAVPDQKPMEQPSPEYLGQDAHVANGVGR